LHAEKHTGAASFGEARRALVQRLLDEACRADGALVPVARNRLLQDWAASPEADRVREEYGRLPPADRVRMRLPREPDDPERQGNLIVLKTDSGGEPGVLLLKYNPAILDFPALFDLPRLAPHYQIVLEPSWWGYRHHRFLPYLGCDLDVAVQCFFGPDYDYIAGLGSNLVPVRMGPADWADPATFDVQGGAGAQFDVAMVAAWSPWKRHEVLFRALAELKARGRALRAALVGYPWDWTADRIVRLARRHGVAEQCTLFEQVPHAKVAEILARSRCSVVLSREEGSPKALYESIFCGTPPVVYAGNRGIDLARIRPPVGMTAGDAELARVLAHVLDHPEEFDPRGWALRHTGYGNSTRRLNDVLAEMAARRGRAWRRGIAAKKNAPNLRYAEPGASARFAPEYDRLATFLR